MRSIVITALCSLVLSQTAVGQVKLSCPARNTIESVPIKLSASALLPAALLKSNSWSISEEVVSDGFLNTYHVVTPTKEYFERGTSRLAMRLGELEALRQLREYTSSEAFLNATAKSGLAVVTAPARAVRAVGEAVIDPKGTWDTIKNVPSGVAGLFDHVGKEISKYWGKSKRAIAGNPTEKKKNQAEIADRASKEGMDYAARWSGYSSSEKEWYKRLEIDPYTDNDELRYEIARVARIESGVSIAFKFVPGVGGIAYVGQINRGLSYSRSVAVYSAPEELRNKHRAALKELGISSAIAEPFLNSPLLSPTLQTIAIEYIKDLKGIKGLDGVIKAISRSDSVESAWFLIESIRYLAVYHRAIKPLTELVGDFVTPAGLNKDRTLIIALPLDQMVMTGAFYRRWCALAKVLSGRRKVKSVELRFRSTISPGLRGVLDQPHVYVFEKVDI